MADAHHWWMQHYSHSLQIFNAMRSGVVAIAKGSKPSDTRRNYYRRRLYFAIHAYQRALDRFKAVGHWMKQVVRFGEFHDLAYFLPVQRELDRAQDEYLRAGQSWRLHDQSLRDHSPKVSVNISVY